MKVRKIIKHTLAALLILPSITMADDFWVGVFDKDTGYTDQSYTTSKSLARLQTKIENEWNKGYTLIDINYGHDVWMAVYAKGTGYTQQALMHRRDLKKFQKAINTYRQKGFELTNATVTTLKKALSNTGETDICLSMLKLPKGTGQASLPRIPASKERNGATATVLSTSNLQCQSGLSFLPNCQNQEKKPLPIMKT